MTSRNKNISQKSNCCIFIISARKKILHECIRRLDYYYNFQFNYPIKIFYFGKKYDDSTFKESIQKINHKTPISFHKLKPHMPAFLNDVDMFYNLQNDWVVKNFPKTRKGYLFANYFWNNFMNHKELSGFDFLMRLDDDSYFKNEISYSFFDSLSNAGKMMGTGYTVNKFNYNLLSCRRFFLPWVQNYIKKYNITPKSKYLHNLVSWAENCQMKSSMYKETINYNKNFNLLPIACGNLSVFNMSMFKKNSWKNYLKEYNLSGGGYRYRWADTIVMSMYYYIHLGDNFLNFDLLNKQLYEGKINTQKNITIHHEEI